MMRKKRVLLLLMAGVVCLIGVIIGAVYAINCHFPPIYIPFKICIGEGGVLRRVGKVVAHDCDDEIEYSAYIGNARCFSGRRMQGMLLIPEQLPEDTVKRCTWYPWKQLLVDRNRLSHGAMQYLRLPFGYLPTTGIGGIDVASGKGFSGKLTIEEVGDSQMYKFEYNYPSKKIRNGGPFVLRFQKRGLTLFLVRKTASCLVHSQHRRPSNEELVCLKSHFPVGKNFYDLRLDLRFVWYNGYELGDGQ